MNIKRILALLLALLLLGCVALADAPDPVADYEGEWVSDRALLTVEELDDIVYCTVSWANSAFENVEWEYTAAFDEAAGGLATRTGAKRVVTYGDDGEVASSEEEYNDGAATFTLNDDGTLTWTDLKAVPGESTLVFERVPEEE